MTVPKYLHIKKNMISKIENGEFLPGDKFYSEAELRSSYGVSSTTVVRVLNDLVLEGYLVRYQGKGTFVSKGRSHKLVKISDLETFESNHVVEARIMKNPEIAKKLNLGEDDSFYHIKKIYHIEGTPIKVQNSYLILECLVNIKLSHFAKNTEIYARVREDTGINLFQCDVEERLEIEFPPSDEVLIDLQMKEPFPMVKVSRYSSLYGKVMEYVESYKHWKYFSIGIEYV